MNSIKVNIELDLSHERCLEDNVHTLGDAMSYLTGLSKEQAWITAIITYVSSNGVPEDFDLHNICRLAYASLVIAVDRWLEELPQRA